MLVKGTKDAIVNAIVGISDSDQRLVDSEDLEYNNISGMAKRDILDVKTENERRAVNVCWKTKLVRDDIAHLRAPKPELLSELIQAMDGLVHLD